MKDLRFYWYLVPIIVIFIFYFLKWIKIQFKFGQNLRRIIYFLKTSEEKKLETQRDQIKNLSLFNIENNIKDIQKSIDTLQNLKKKSVFIVGYSKDFDYKKLFYHATHNRIPIIIFATQGEIKKLDHWEIFNECIFCDVANTSNRLLIILVNILKII